MNYLELKTELETSEFNGKNDGEILAIFNEPVLNGLDHTPRTVVNNYCNNNDIIDRLQDILDTAVSEDNPYDALIPGTDGYTIRRLARNGMNLFLINTGELVNPNNEKLNLCVAALQQVGVFTSQEVEGFWNVFRIPTSRALTTYGQELSQRDLNIARLYDRWQAESTALNTARTQLSVQEFRVAELASGRDPDEVSG